MIRVFLVDDHTVLRQGLRLILQDASDMEVVGEAGTGTDALKRIPAVQPDVVLLDVNLPDMSGVEVARALRDRVPGVRVVMLTVSDRHQDLIAAVQAGVRGYILKNASSDEVVNAIREVMQGGAVLPPRLTAHLLDAFVSPPDPLDTLTDRELQVLRLITHGLGNKEIAARLRISEHTVKTHVRNILSKLNAKSRAEAAAYAVKRGLVEES